MHIRQVLSYLLITLLFLNFVALIINIDISYSKTHIEIRNKTNVNSSLSKKQREDSRENNIEHEKMLYEKDKNSLLSSSLTNSRTSESFSNLSNRTNTRSPSNYSARNWVDTRWRYRKNITISASKVSTDLTNFPLLINLYDDDLRLALTSGVDIFFTDSTGKKLAHEIEYYERFYSSTQARLVTWVETNLSSTVDTVISMYYGNPLAEIQENHTAVWDTNYAAVWHLNEDPTDSISDSTINNNDGFSIGSMTSNDQITGQIDGSLAFDGTNDFINVPQNSVLDFSSSGMISGWFRLDSPFSSFSSTSQIIVEKYFDDFKNFVVVLVGGDYGSTNPSKGSLCFKIENGGYIYTYTSRTSWSADTWYYYVAIIDADNSLNNKLYINGIDDTAEVVAVGNANLGYSADFNIGGKDADGTQLITDRYFKGQIDEVRVSSIIRSSKRIFTQYDNQIDPSGFYSVGSIEIYESEHGWYYPALNYRKNITIDHEKVVTDLINFPVLINLYDTDLHEKVQLDGDDIIFTDVLGTKLDHEIESFIKNYNSTHAHLTVWVKIPILSSSVGTIITMYFGNSTISNEEVPWGTWEEYMGVWHLGESVSDEGSATNVHIDSTSNANHGDQHGNNDITGQIYKGQDFDGTNDYIEMGDPDVLDMKEDEQYTITGWFYWDSTTNRDTLLAKRVGSSFFDEGYSIWVNYNGDGHLYFEVADNDQEERRIRTISDFNTLPTGWYHFAFIIDLNNADNWAVYINGIDDNGYITGDSLFYIQNPANNIDFTLGRETGGNYPFNGKLDEIRIANLLRTAEWVETEFENQLDPNSWFSVGPLSYNDFAPPIVNSFGVDDEGTGTGKFWANITDNLAGVTSAFIRINETDYAMSNNGTHWTYQLSVAYENNYVYQIVNASDAIGHNLTTPSDSKSYTFNYDSLPPIVDEWEYFPTTDIYSFGTFNANVSDAWGIIDAVIINVTDSQGGVFTAVMRLTASGYINDTLELATGTIDFNVIVNDTSGNSYSSPIHTSYVPEQNNPPSVSNLVLTPDPVHSNETLTLNYTFTDLDNDLEIGTEIRWCKNNVLQSTFNDLKTIPSQILNTGDQWNVSVRPKDGKDFGNLVWSSTITIKNTVPQIISYFITPTKPTNASILTCIYSYFDHDNNPENTANREIKWYKDEELQSHLNNSLLVSASETTRGETWYFKLRVHDNTNFSDWMTSVNVTIGNTSPTASNVLINATSPADNDSAINATYTYSDYDDDLENISMLEIRWYRNGTVQTDLDNVLVVEPEKTKRGDFWYFVIRVSDGTNYSNWEYSPSVSISVAENTPPDAQSLIITPASPKTGDDLFINWVFVDPDEDEESGSLFYWYCNDVHMSEYDGLQTLPASATSKGQEWHVKVRPRDGIDFGDLEGVPVNVTIGNTAPTATDLAIFPSGDIYTITTLLASFESLDIDNDQIVGYELRWFNNSDEVLGLYNHTEVTSNYTNKNQNWKFQVQVYDGENWSNPVESNEITIKNSIPYLENVNLSGGMNTTININLNYTFVDPDGDQESVDTELEWWISHLGSLTPLTPGTVGQGNRTLDSSKIAAGDFVFCKITPKDGENAGIPVFSNTYPYGYIVVGDSAPVIIGTPSIIGPNGSIVFNATSPLYANYTAFDIDQGESEERYTLEFFAGLVIGAEYKWYKNGELTQIITSYVDTQYLKEGDTWKLSVRVRDRYGLPSAWYNSSVIIIENSKPVILDISWSSSSPTTSVDLVLFYDFYDYDNDYEGMTWVQWFINGVEFTSNENETTLTHNHFIKEDRIFAIVSPHDGKEYGIAYNSTEFTSIIRVVNTPPIVLSPMINNNTLVYTTDNLLLTWKYFDADTDPENSSIILWYVNGEYRSEFTNEKTIFSEFTQKNERWLAVIRVFDGYIESNTSSTIPVYIQNSPIIINEIQINNNADTAYASNELSISINAIDPDGDVIIDYITYWYENGTIREDLLKNITISSTELQKGEVWYSIVKVYDGEQWSSNKTSQVISIVNSPPIVFEIEFVFEHINLDPIDDSREFFLEDETITMRYSLIDIDNTDSDKSIIYWYQNGVLQVQYTNKTNIPANITSPGDIWYFVIIPCDGYDTGSLIYSKNITIESRPTIFDFDVEARPDEEGFYHIWVQTNDELNDIYQVEFLITVHKFKYTQNNPEKITTYNGTLDFWVWNDFNLSKILNGLGYQKINFTNLIDTPITVQITVVTQVSYPRGLYFIKRILSFDFMIEDEVPPRVVNAYYDWDNEQKPTSITFYAEVEDFGTGVNNITLLYFIRPFEDEEESSSEGRSKFSKYYLSNMFLKTTNFSVARMEPINATHYQVIIDYTPKENVEIGFQIQVSDKAGNIDSNAYPLGLDPQRIREGRFYYKPTTGLSIEIVMAILVVFIIISSIASYVAITKFRKTELVGLDIDQVMKSAKDVVEEEIRRALSSHTLGILISRFDQLKGPIPIFVEPTILRDNFNTLVDLSDRSFSAIRFVDDFETERHTIFEFNLAQGVSITSIAFGFSLNRPEARGNAENINLNILVRKPYDSLIPHFHEFYSAIVHEIHVRMDQSPSEKDQIAKDIIEIRKLITSIIISYEKIYGSVEDFETE